MPGYRFEQGEVQIPDGVVSFSRGGAHFFSVFSKKSARHFAKTKGTHQLIKAEGARQLAKKVAQGFWVLLTGGGGSLNLPEPHCWGLDKKTAGAALDTARHFDP